MKVYIKSQSYRRRELPNYQAWFKAIKRDIRNVAACQDEEDLANLKLTSGNSDYEKRIWNERFEKKGVTDFDEKIDLIIDWLYDSANYIKETADKYSSEIEVADVLQDKIIDFLSKDYNCTVTPEGIEVTCEAMNRDALINMIDSLITNLNGRYHGTGRGGSWTAWNILLYGDGDKGIEYQIGPNKDRTAWLIREC